MIQYQQYPLLPNWFQVGARKCTFQEDLSNLVTTECQNQMMIFKKSTMEIFWKKMMISVSNEAIKTLLGCSIVLNRPAK